MKFQTNDELYVLDITNKLFKSDNFLDEIMHIKTGKILFKSLKSLTLSKIK